MIKTRDREGARPYWLFIFYSAEGRLNTKAAFDKEPWISQNTPETGKDLLPMKDTQMHTHTGTQTHTHAQILKPHVSCNIH